MKSVLITTLSACVCATTLRADFSYQQDAQITGGAVAAMMKWAGAFSKQAREPIVTHVYVKGHRIAHVSERSAEITDMDKETITTVNFDRKTYSVVTFAQMKQQFEQMSKDVQDKKQGTDLNMNMNVSAKNTGQTKEISGMPAKELILTMAVQGTDPQSGQSGTMDIRSDMWMAKVDGYDEVREAYKLMGEKLGFVTSGSFLPMQRPDLVKNMGELYKEMGKIEGMPIETVMSMGGSGTPTASSNSGSTGSSSAATSSDSKAAEVASDAAVATAMSRLGGIAGGLGGFGRRKKKSDDDQQQNQSQQSAGAAQSGSQSGAGNSGSLMEMTTRASAFSTAAIDDSRFSVPAGFKEVDPETDRRRRR